MLAFPANRERLQRARRRFRAISAAIAAAFLAALLVFSHQSYAVRQFYWTFCRLAEAVFG